MKYGQIIYLYNIYYNDLQCLFSYDLGNPSLVVSSFGVLLFILLLCRLFCHRLIVALSIFGELTLIFDIFITVFLLALLAIFCLVLAIFRSVDVQIKED